MQRHKKPVNSASFKELPRFRKGFKGRIPCGRQHVVLVRQEPARTILLSRIRTTAPIPAAQFGIDEHQILVAL